MKHKFRSMGRVAIALVLALSLTLVMAVPVVAGNGSGACTVDPTEVMAGSTGNTLTFTFTADEAMDSGNQISITMPTGWSPPFGTEGTAGYTTATADVGIEALGFSSQVVTVTLTATLAIDEIITVVYGAGGGTSGAVAASPTASEDQEFVVKSYVIDALEAIADSPDVTVWVLHHFGVVPDPLNPVVGETSIVTITAQDSVDADITIYPGENLDLNQANADEPASLTWSGADVFNDGDGTGRFVGNWTNGVCTVDVSYTKADNAVTLGVTGETTGKVGTSDPVTWGAVAILTIEGTAYQNGNDTIVIGFNTEVQPTDEEPWDADVFTYVKCGETSLSLDGASYTPASGLTDTLTITLDETNDYLVFGQAMKVDPATDAIKDASDNFVPTGEKIGDNVSGDQVDPTFTIAYYTDDALTSLLVGDYMKAGTYYIKITASEALSATPTIEIDAEGSANDVADPGEATTAVSGSTKVFQYTRTIASDDDAVGSVKEDVTITGTDLAGRTTTDYDVPDDQQKHTDTVAPTIESIEGTTVDDDSDTIAITFSEVSGEITTPAAEAWTKDAFTYIKCGLVELVLPDASTSYVYASKVLTITLDKNTEGAYLVNADALAVKAVANAIQDAAGNAVSVDEETGTITNTETDAPTFTVAASVIETGDDTITIIFNQMVRAADETWSANEFTIDSPDTAPLNINHATFAPATGMTDSLTITLNEATDGSFLVVGDAVKVYKVVSAVLDLAGNDVSTVNESSTAIADPTDPSIVSVVGTTIQDAGDTIEITFSEAVFPAEAEDPVWSTNEFNDIGGFTTDTAVFSIDGTNTVLTITLDEATDEAYLVNDDMVAVTPDFETIEDVDGNFVANTEVTSAAAVSGELTLPTIESIVGWDDADVDANDQDIIRIDFSEAITGETSWEIMLPSIKCGTDDVNLAGAGFLPEWADIGATTTSVIITLAPDGEGFELTPGETLTVTPGTDAETPVATIVDLAGNEMSTDPVVGEAVNQGYAIDLVAGWNLISLPLVPPSYTITAVLDNLTTAGTVDEVRTYDTQQEDFSIWAPSGPVTLDQMQDGTGYWVKMNTADILVGTGREIPAPPGGPRSYDVYEGWNMIGFKSLTAVDLVGYLGEAIVGNEVAGTLEAIYGYNAATGFYFIPTTLEPGYGYWLAVNDDGTIYP